MKLKIALNEAENEDYRKLKQEYTDMARRAESYRHFINKNLQDDAKLVDLAAKLDIILDNLRRHAHSMVQQ